MIKFNAITSISSSKFNKPNSKSSNTQYLNRSKRYDIITIALLSSHLNSNVDSIVDFYN